LEGDTFKNHHAAALEAIETEAEKEEVETPVKPFPPYTMRHTALTRMGEAGIDSFTLMRIAGHSSITITQRYCHPQAEAISRAFSKLGPQSLQKSLQSALPPLDHSQVVHASASIVRG
jgi:site-specific recombinase XerD